MKQVNGEVKMSLEAYNKLQEEILVNENIINSDYIYNGFMGNHLCKKRTPAEEYSKMLDNYKKESEEKTEKLLNIKEEEIEELILRLRVIGILFIALFGICIFLFSKLTY